MREYELTVVYDLALAEAGGADAAVKHLGAAIEARGGKLLKADHWGRRRMAYPIGQAIDGDYVVSRVELEAPAVRPLEQALRIDERVYRHLIVRADELPAPPQPREPRRPPESASIEAGVDARSAAEPEAAAAPEAPAREPVPAAEAAPAETAVEATNVPDEPTSAASAGVESGGDEAAQAEAPMAEPEAAEDQPAPAEPTA